MCTLCNTTYTCNFLFLAATLLSISWDNYGDIPERWNIFPSFFQEIYNVACRSNDGVISISNAIISRSAGHKGNYFCICAVDASLSLTLLSLCGWLLRRHSGRSSYCASVLLSCEREAYKRSIFCDFFCVWLCKKIEFNRIFLFSRGAGNDVVSGDGIVFTDVLERCVCVCLCDFLKYRVWQCTDEQKTYWLLRLIMTCHWLFAYITNNRFIVVHQHKIL